DRHNQTIVRSTIELGHNLGLKVTAEGIEDAEAPAMLARMGCDTGQGFFIGRPPPTLKNPIPWLLLLVSTGVLADQILDVRGGFLYDSNLPKAQLPYDIKS